MIQDTQQRLEVQPDEQPSYPGTYWQWGFTPSAEIWNGRFAMLALLLAAFIEILIKQGILRI